MLLEELNKNQELLTTNKFLFRFNSKIEIEESEEELKEELINNLNLKNKNNDKMEEQQQHQETIKQKKFIKKTIEKNFAEFLPIEKVSKLSFFVKNNYFYSFETSFISLSCSPIYPIYCSLLEENIKIDKTKIENHQKLQNHHFMISAEISEKRNNQFWKIGNRRRRKRKRKGKENTN